MGAYDGSFIYHGSMGTGAYQQVVTTMMPRRMLSPLFHGWSARTKLGLAEWLQPKVRRWARWWYSRDWSDGVKKSVKKKCSSNQGGEEKLYQPEVTVDVASENARLELLENLINLGWSEDKSSQKWDVCQSNEKLLVAQEEIGDRHWRLKIRLQAEHRNSSTMETIVNLAGRR